MRRHFTFSRLGIGGRRQVGAFFFPPPPPPLDLPCLPSLPSLDLLSLYLWWKKRWLFVPSIFSYFSYLWQFSFLLLTSFSPCSSFLFPLCASNRLNLRLHCLSAYGTMAVLLSAIRTMAVHLSAYRTMAIGNTFVCLWDHGYTCVCL